MKAIGILCVVLLLGCKSQPTRLADLLDRSSSWLATAEAVARTTVANRTPVRYADDTFEDAEEELKRAGSGIDALDVAPDIRADGRRIIDAGARTIGHLRAAIDAHARDVSHDVEMLSAQADSLKDLGDRAKQAGR